MKKITYLFLLIGFSVFAQFPAPYCGPITFGFAVEPITLVNFAGINNSSSNVVAGATAHEDYTAISGAVTAGSSYTVTLKGNTDGNWTNRFMVFADWNQDGDFADAGEAYEIIQTITNSTGLDAAQVTQSLAVPVTALGGTTRMRVKKIFGLDDYTNPCLGAGFGQIEDYSLTVTASTDCTGTPNPGNTISSASSICPSIAFTLSLQNDVAASGITYQWQISSDGVAFTDAPGTSNEPTYSATQSEVTYYQCVVTCVPSGESASSTPVMVGLDPVSACYCTPIYTNGTVDGDLISNIVIQGTTLSNNSGATPGGASYTYYTGQPNYTAELQAGNSYTVEVTVGTFGGQNVAVWIDYNDNGVFETSERVGFTTTAIAADGTASFNITLACNPPVGLHRMRVRDVWNTTGADIDPCASYGWGETEDYDVTITSAVACPQPNNLAVTSITAESAILVWNIGCAETSWDVHVGLQGEGEPTGEPSNPDVTSPLEIFGLLPNTAYEFYVRANCEGDGLSEWAGPFEFMTLNVAPDCSDVVTPADGAVDVQLVASGATFTWTESTTGATPTAYNIYFGTEPGDLVLLGNIDDITVDINGLLYGTTYYWQAIPFNDGGEAVGCAVWSFTTQNSPGFCLDGELFPAGTYTPSICDGTTENVIVENAWAGEFSNVNVIAGETYTFLSSVATDFITISSDDGATATAFGTTPLTWTSDVTGVIRFYIHTSDQCGVEDTNRIRSIVCGEVSTDSPDYVNLQFPYTATIEENGSVTVYGQIYEGGLTDVEPGLSGQAVGIEAWVGVSPVGENSNPNTWTNWVAATYNPGNVDDPNNDEYQAEIGDGLAPGTYYYATRFRLNNGPFVYGGTNDGFWDGVTYLSGVLTVNPVPAPANDDCSGAIALTVGAVYSDNPVDVSNAGATDSTQADPTICFGYDGGDVWYSVVVPDSGSITIETSTSTGGNGIDTVVTVYAGDDCDNLTEVACSDDDSPESTYGFSLLTLTDIVPGTILYLRVYEYNNDVVGSFSISAFDESLSTPGFDSANFSYHPNPVKDVLNLSYSSAISKVTVFNLLGQQMFTREINASQSQLDLSSLANGAYLVKVSTEDNLEKTIKVIKQ